MTSDWKEAFNSKTQRVYNIFLQNQMCIFLVSSFSGGDVYFLGNVGSFWNKLKENISIFLVNENFFFFCLC